MLSFAKNRLSKVWRAFSKDESGVTLIEYGLVAMIITTIVVVFVNDLSSQKLWSVFSRISSGLDSMHQSAEQ